MARLRFITRRQNWLAARRRKSFTTPKPVVIRVMNADSVSAGPRHVRRVWENAHKKSGRWGVPDVVLCSEMADIQVSGPGVRQIGALGTAESALAASVNTSRGRLERTKLVPGSEQTAEGGGIRRRPILVGDIRFDAGTPQEWILPFADAHAAPSRAAKARQTLLVALKKVDASFKAGDFNINRARATTFFKGRVHSAGVLHAVVARWIPSVAARVDIGSGHDALDVLLWPTGAQKKRQRRILKRRARR